jgi:predicted DNA-binding transcriptional regulator AlpA
MTPRDDDELLDSRAAALYLSLSERTLERWRRDRHGPNYRRLSARAIRYRLGDLRAWRDGCTVECSA